LHLCRPFPKCVPCFLLLLQLLKSGSKARIILDGDICGRQL
jgi:hypothetical protein